MFQTCFIIDTFSNIIFHDSLLPKSESDHEGIMRSGGGNNENWTKSNLDVDVNIWENQIIKLYFTTNCLILCL